MMQGTLLGKTIGRCRIERLIGKGGMGAVYLGHHETLDRNVAVKILPTELSLKDEDRERFLREARTAAKLDHPNVVQVYDVGEEEGIFYITMQLIEGHPLDQFMKQRPLSTADSIAIVKRVAAALGAAHKLGIVHRDIKPSNILISNEGVVKVTDFGLAKELDSGATLSQSGVILGTPHYLPPEQAEGKPTDGRSDLYSLGATFYQLITNHFPFKGDTGLAIVLKHMKEPVPPPRTHKPDLPEEVERIVLKLMEKKPSDRYATAEELISDLDRFKRSGGATRRLVREAAPTDRKKPVLIAVIAACILTLSLVVWAVSGGGDPVKETPVVNTEKPEPKPGPEPEPEPKPKLKPNPKVKPETPFFITSDVDGESSRSWKIVKRRMSEFAEALRRKDHESASRFMDPDTFDKKTIDSLLRKIQGKEKTGELARVRVRKLQFPQLPTPQVGVVTDVTWAIPEQRIERTSEMMFWWVDRNGTWLLTPQPVIPFFQYSEATRSLESLPSSDRRKGAALLERMRLFMDTARKGRGSDVAGYIDPEKYDRRTIKRVAEEFARRLSGKRPGMSASHYEATRVEIRGNQGTVTTTAHARNIGAFKPKPAETRFIWMLRDGEWYLNEVPSPNRRRRGNPRRDD